jgi:Fe2+ transport system protein FeoA
MATILLTQLRPGQIAIVQGFSPKINPQYRKLLQHLGLRLRTAVTFIRLAPLGDPLQLQILGSQFSLRAHEASHIYVKSLN